MTKRTLTFFAISVILIYLCSCRGKADPAPSLLTCGFTCFFSSGDIIGTLTVGNDYCTEITAELPGDTSVSVKYDRENVTVFTDGLTYTEDSSGIGMLCPAVYIGEAFYSLSQNELTDFDSCIRGTCRSGDFSVAADKEGKPVFIWLDSVKMQFDLKNITLIK